MWALWRTGGCLPGSKDPIRRKCVQHSFFMAQSIRTFCTQEPLSGPWRASIQSVRFSRSVVSDTLQPHGLQDARLPCPSSNPGAHSNSCLSSQWCHPTMSSSVIPFASCLQSFSASESFLMSQFFASGGQSIGASASASVLPMNIQDWFTLGLTDWIFLHYRGLSRVFSNTTVKKHQLFVTQPALWSNSHIHTWQLETIALTTWTCVGKVIDIGRGKKNKSYKVKNKKTAFSVSRWRLVSLFLRMGKLYWGQHMSHSRDHLLGWMTCQTM